MIHGTTICVAFCFAIIWALCKTETRTKFNRHAPLDGDICDGSDVVFSKCGISGTMACLSECTNNVNCLSVFHDKGNEICTGCKLFYDISNRPSGKANGTRYYRKYKEFPEGWFDIGNSRYFITNVRRSYADGKLFCLAHDSYPIRMETEEENTKIIERLKTLIALEFYFTAYTYTEGRWEDNGTELTFNGWFSNYQPVGIVGYNCLVYDRWSDRKWVYIPCDYPSLLICERGSV